MSTSERIRQMLTAGDRPPDIAAKLHVSTYRVLMVQKRFLGLPARLRERTPRLIEGPAHWYG